MALRDLDAPPEHIAKTAAKITKAAKKGKVVRIPKAKKQKKARVLRDSFEAEDVKARADHIMGAESFRMRGIVSEKVLYLFVPTENVGGGCLDGTIKLGRYPRLMRWKSGLRYDFLVVASKPRWERMTDEEKTRATYHAIRHIRLDSDGRRGIEPHDHEGFYAEVEFFGLRSPEVKKIAEQLDLFEHRAKKGGE